MANLSALTQTAVGGLRQSLERFDRAAATLAQPLALVAEDQVSIEGSKSPDWVGASVDLRVQKYAAVANLRVLGTAAEVEREALAIGARR